MLEIMSHIAKEDDKQPRTCSDDTVEGCSAGTICSSFCRNKERIIFGKREQDQGRKVRTRGDLVPERLAIMIPKSNTGPAKLRKTTSVPSPKNRKEPRETVAMIMTSNNQRYRRK